MFFQLNLKDRRTTTQQTLRQTWLKVKTGKPAERDKMPFKVEKVFIPKLGYHATSILVPK